MKLTKTQKIIATFAIITAIAFLLWGCANPSETAKSASDSLKVDTTLVDSVKIDTIGKK